MDLLRAPLFLLLAPPLLASPAPRPCPRPAPIQDPYEDPLDEEDPWAPFPLPDLDLGDSRVGDGEGLLLIDGRRWAGAVEVGDFATWWITPAGGEARRVHGDSVVLAEFDGERDYRGQDKILVAALAHGEELRVREFALQTAEEYFGARAFEDAQRMLDLAKAHGLDAAGSAAFEAKLAPFAGKPARPNMKVRAPIFVRELAFVEGIGKAWAALVENWQGLHDSDGKEHTMLGVLLVQQALARLPEDKGLLALREQVLPADCPFRGKPDGFEQWLAWGQVLERVGARFADDAERLRQEAPGEAFSAAGLVIESENLLVLSHSDDAEMVEHTLLVGEATVRELAALLGDRPGQGNRLRVGIHKSRKMYLDEAGAEALINTAGYYRPADGTSRFFIPRGDAFDAGAAVRDLRKVVAHELTHQYLSQRWRGGAGSGGPATPGYWVVEGFARFIEDQLWMEDRPEGRLDFAGSESLRACSQLARDGKLFDAANIVDWNQGQDFAGLDAERPNRGALGMTDVGRFYEQGGAMVFFFVNGGDGDRRQKFFDYMWNHYQAVDQKQGWQALGFKDSVKDGVSVSGARLLDQALREYLVALGKNE